MGIHEQANNEADLLQEQFASGELTRDEYNRYMRDLEEEMYEYERDN